MNANDDTASTNTAHTESDVVSILRRGLDGPPPHPDERLRSMFDGSEVASHALASESEVVDIVTSPPVPRWVAGVAAAFIVALAVAAGALMVRNDSPDTVAASPATTGGSPQSFGLVDVPEDDASDPQPETEAPPSTVVPDAAPQSPIEVLECLRDLPRDEGPNRFEAFQECFGEQLFDFENWPDVESPMRCLDIDSDRFSPRDDAAPRIVIWDCLDIERFPWPDRFEIPEGFDLPEGFDFPEGFVVPPMFDFPIPRDFEFPHDFEFPEGLDLDELPDLFDPDAEPECFESSSDDGSAHVKVCIGGGSFKIDAEVTDPR